ncbi:MAG: phospholipase D-like domain-containing protein [Candidatus Carbobacillus sp.]|nr:phospholipase D-like domain-containing protein [Candidatus Carbobacillus sp.]
MASRKIGSRFNRLWYSLIFLFAYMLGIETYPWLNDTVFQGEPLHFQAHSDGVYFTRNGEKPDEAVLSLIQASKESIHLAIYALTEPRIVDALIRAHARGVNVQIITDFKQTQGDAQNKAIRLLIDKGIPVRVNSHQGLMHLKLLIVDQREAAVGSFNYSKAASTINDEVVVLLSDPEAVQHFEKTFASMWHNTKDYRPFYP